MNKCIVLAATLTLATPAAAQVAPPPLHNHALGLAAGVPDTCAADPAALIIPAGQTRTVAGPLTLSCFGIHGTVTITGEIKFSTLILYDEGSVTLAEGATLTIRDTPLDPIADPEQFATGVLLFGRARANGHRVTPDVRLAVEVAPGVLQLQLAAVPTGWTVGDELALPDSRQNRTGVSESETIRLAALDGLTVTLATATRFGHRGGRDPDGALVVLPHVANLTRSIVIRSENEQGTRGHVIAMQRADVDLRGVEFRGLGRTTADPIDSTAIDAAGLVTHRGTNQVGRYALHFHHDTGPVVPQPDGTQWACINCSINRFRKWGVAVHNSHFGVLQGSTVWDGQGAGVVTEDGSETGNLFLDNFVGNVRNPTPKDLVFGEFETDPNFRRGNCFIFRAPGSEIRGNVCADTREGLNLLSEAADGAGPTSANLVVRVAKGPGLDTASDDNVASTFVFYRPRGVIDNNELYAVDIGIGVWGQSPNRAPATSPPFTRTYIWHVGSFVPQVNISAAIFAKYTDADWIDLTLLNEGGLGRAFAQHNDANGGGLGSAPSSFLRADIRGFALAWGKVGQIGQAPVWTVTDSVFQNVQDFAINNVGQQSTGAFDPASPIRDAAGVQVYPWYVERPAFTWTNTRFLPMPGLPLKVLETRLYTAEDRLDLSPRREFNLRFVKYQGVTGQDLRVYFLAPSNGEAPAPCQAMRPEFVGFACGLTDATPPAPPPAPSTVRILKGTL